MFAYCNNNAIQRVDPHGKKYTSALGVDNIGAAPNVQNIMNVFGVCSPLDIPERPDNAMIFMETVTSIPTPIGTIVFGHTIVMDDIKYCTYDFTGVGVAGLSKIKFFSQATTAGYVYNLDDPSDYAGRFTGGSVNLLKDGWGGAWAPGSNVYAVILGTEGYLVTDVGFTFTNYTQNCSKWIYGQAPITWRERLYPGLFNQNNVV